MEKKYFPRKFRVYLPLILLLVMLVFLMPTASKFTYDYRKGEPWMYETLVSQFDFPVLKTEKQYADDVEKVASSVIPFYRKDNFVSRSSVETLSEINLDGNEALRQILAAELNDIYDKGVIASSSGNRDTLNMRLILVQKDRSTLKLPASEVYTVEQAQQRLYDALASYDRRSVVDSIYRSSGLSRIVEPDLIFDQQATEALHRESIENVARTKGVFRAGQTIVSSGDIVTAEIVQLLDSYKAEYETSVGYSGNAVFLWAGHRSWQNCI